VKVGGFGGFAPVIGAQIYAWVSGGGNGGLSGGGLPRLSRVYTLLSIPVVSAATSVRPYFPLNSKNTKTSPAKRPCRRGCANNRN